MTEKINNFYYCGKLALKFVYFKVDNNIFGNT